LPFRPAHFRHQQHHPTRHDNSHGSRRPREYPPLSSSPRTRTTTRQADLSDVHHRSRSRIIYRHLPPDYIYSPHRRARAAADSWSWTGTEITETISTRTIISELSEASLGSSAYWSERVHRRFQS
jgi:hypothetical protein